MAWKLFTLTTRVVFGDGCDCASYDKQSMWEFPVSVNFKNENR